MRAADAPPRMAFTDASVYLFHRAAQTYGIDDKMRSIEQQIATFMSADRDRPSGTLTRSYIICSAPRTGSSMLCRTLIDTGCAGIPSEYLHPLAMSAYAQRIGAPNIDLERYFDFLKSNRSPGGILGSKVHFHQLEDLAPDTVAQQAVLAHFGSVVLVRRRNKLRQAISYVRALLSGTWFADDQAHAEVARRAASHYDAAKLTAALTRLAAEDEGWDALLGAAGRPVLVLHYEDMVTDFPGTLRAVSDHVGLNLDIADNLTPTTETLGDETNAAWEEQFRRDVLSA